MAKKAFKLPRDSIYSVDPGDHLCIVGGKGVLAGDERGKLDTAPDGNQLEDLDLREPLKDTFVANVDHYGVIVPIIVAKVDDVMVVVDGRTRVRAARAVNVGRKKRGEVPISIRCQMRREDKSGVNLIGAMITTNNQRRAETTASKIEKAKSMLARGGSEEDVALSFDVKPATVRGWLDFEDNATAATKRAAASGRLSATAAAQVARIKDPDKQNAALAKLLEAPGKSSVKAAKIARGASATPSRTEIRSFANVLTKPGVEELVHQGDPSLKFPAGWVEGAEQVVEWFMTGKESPAISRVLAKVLAASASAGPTPRAPDPAAPFRAEAFNKAQAKAKRDAKAAGGGDEITS